MKGINYKLLTINYKLKMEAKDFSHGCTRTKDTDKKREGVRLGDKK